MADSGEATELIALEEQRYQALNDKDVDRAATFYGEAFLHYHGHGRIDTKEAELESFRSRPRVTRRENIEVRIFGHTALMTGLAFRGYEDTDFAQRPPLHIMQVWLRRDGRWQLIATHDCLMEPPR